MVSKKDIVIMSHLRANARVSLSDLSRKTGIPVSTLFDRVKSSESITRHVSLVDFSSLGFSTRASIMLSVSPSSRDALATHLLKHPFVNSLLRVSGSFEFLVDCVFRSMKDLEEFIFSLEKSFKIKSKKLHYVVDELKSEAFLSDPRLVDLVFEGD